MLSSSLDNSFFSSSTYVDSFEITSFTVLSASAPRTWFVNDSMGGPPLRSGGLLGWTISLLAEF